MRTIEDVEKDIKSAASAMQSMANIGVEPGSSGQANGIFLDNCARRIRELEAEQKTILDAQKAKKPEKTKAPRSNWDRVRKPSV